MCNLSTTEKELGSNQLESIHVKHHVNSALGEVEVKKIYSSQDQSANK